MYNRLLGFDLFLNSLKLMAFDTKNKSDIGPMVILIAVFMRGCSWHGPECPVELAGAVESSTPLCFCSDDLRSGWMRVHNVFSYPWSGVELNVGVGLPPLICSGS